MGGVDSLQGVAVPFAKLFIGADSLPTRLSEFDVRRSFSLSADDIAAAAERCRHDRRVAAAIWMRLLRASGRTMGRFASVPMTLPCAACRVPPAACRL